MTPVFKVLKERDVYHNKRDEEVRGGTRNRRNTTWETLDDRLHMVVKICHGDMNRGILTRVYTSEEGDMSWGQLVPVLTDNL